MVRFRLEGWVSLERKRVSIRMGWEDQGLPFARFGFVDVAVAGRWSGGEASSSSRKGMMRKD